ncbi:MAG: ABC transporter substrate-binding protein [Anaerolineae bacterium]|nr:ABC transporter substrate-binding protein [Anaerolineae bacterium]
MSRIVVRQTAQSRWRAVSGWMIVLLITLAALSGCASADPVVKIGLVAPFEGRYRPIGYDVIYSARLAVREINAAGGIDGHRVALVALDDGGDPQQAYDAARTLAVDPNVVAVLGHWLPENTAIAEPIYHEAGLALLPMGEPPYGAVDEKQISAEFRTAYTAVTPFDEQPGPYAQTTYDAMQSLFTILAHTAEEHGTINRQTVIDTMNQ